MAVAGQEDRAGPEAQEDQEGPEGRAAQEARQDRDSPVDLGESGLEGRPVPAADRIRTDLPG